MRDCTQSVIDRFSCIMMSYVAELTWWGQAGGGTVQPGGSFSGAGAASPGFRPRPSGGMCLGIPRVCQAPRACVLTRCTDVMSRTLQLSGAVAFQKTKAEALAAIRSGQRLTFRIHECTVFAAVIISIVTGAFALAGWVGPSQTCCSSSRGKSSSPQVCGRQQAQMLGMQDRTHIIRSAWLLLAHLHMHCFK